MLRRFVTSLLLVSLSTISISAQQTKRNPEEQPRKVKQEPKKAFVNWINDVDLILTQSEREAWKKLATDDEREKFIEDFWRSRDRDPDTEENEFKQEFFERIAYANEHSHPASRAASQIAAGSTSNSESLTKSNRTPRVVCTIGLHMKAAAPPAIDQTTLRPAADAEYVLLKNGKELSKQTEDWRQINDAGQRLTLSRLIDTRSLEPGEYQIQIRIRDHVSGQTITPTATFTIVP